MPNRAYGQSVCDHYFEALKKTTQNKTLKRSFKISSQINGDKNINYTESDVEGRVHFWGNVGSLRIESYFADGKRYSKIQSPFIQDDEWTYQEINSSDSSRSKSFEAQVLEAQSIDCQLIGEQKIKNKLCQILSYSIQKNMPKRSGVDSFLMEMKVKTWFCPTDSLVYKHEYDVTTERLTQTVKSILEYDVPVKIQLPNNAKFEPPIKVMTTVTPTTVNVQKEVIATNDTLAPTANIEKIEKKPNIDSTYARDSIFTSVDQYPEYKDGIAGLSRYISSNIHYPEEARKAGVSGTVNVAFVVELDGKLTDIHIKKGLREDIDTEAKRLIESMTGAWKPAKLNGKDVRAIYSLPLKFEMRE
ncbi:MAG: energy transducer TonB [Saprospiraceae bacterium]|nr:energy transducer TonB [Saprospiraceae bacterium]